MPRTHSREYRSSTVGRYRSLKPWPSNRRIMALLPTPAPPSTTSLILSRSAMFSVWSNQIGDLEHDRETAAASGRHHSQRKIDRSILLLAIQYSYLTRPATRYSSFVRRILIWFPAVVSDLDPAVRNESMAIVAPDRDRSIAINRSETIAFFRSTTSPVVDFSIHLPRLRCDLEGFCILPRGNCDCPSSPRLELKLLLKNKQNRSVIIYLYALRFYWQNWITRKENSV